jgi:hypothetical protein
VDRVAEADEPPDHADTERVQLLDCVAEVVDLELRAHPPRERDAGGPPDLTRLVFEVELNRVQLPLTQERQHALA